MVIFALAPDQTIAQMWSNGVRGGAATLSKNLVFSLLWKTVSDGDAWSDTDKLFQTDAAAAGKAW